MTDESMSATDSSPARDSRRQAAGEFMRIFRMRKDLKLYALRLAILVLFLIVWRQSVEWGLINKLFVSTPSEVGRYLWKSSISGSLGRHTIVTLREALLGFLLGASLGVMVGLLLARYRLIGHTVDPYLTFLNAIPRVALAPLFLLWFGLREASKVALAASIVFFVLEVVTRSAVAMVDRDLITIAHLMGANSRQTYVRVVLPSIVPALFGGFRLGVVYSVLGAVLGEMLAAQSGLGAQLTVSAGLFQTDAVIGLLFVMGLLATCINVIMTRVEKYLLRWNNNKNLNRQRGQL